MEIGGYDLTYRAKATQKQSLDYAKRIISIIWPLCMFEDDEDNGFFAYKNEASKESWDKDGVTKENDDSMINVLTSEHQITFVVGSKEGITPRLQHMIEMFRTPLYDKIFVKDECEKPQT
jgi:hypothetical protein